MANVDPQAIRRHSLETATKLGYPINPHLPLLDVPSACRCQSEILDRLFAMHCVAACSYGFDRRRAAAWYQREVLGNGLTEQERTFLATGSGDRERFMAQVDGMWALAWAVRLVEDLDFAVECSRHFAGVLPNLKTNESSQALRSKARMRSLTELLAACDLAYCLHWGVRETQLSGVTLPGKIDAWAVIERRRALEWVLYSEDWNEITLDT